jgi:hypothetical protein
MEKLISDKEKAREVEIKITMEEIKDSRRNRNYIVLIFVKKLK